MYKKSLTITILSLILLTSCQKAEESPNQDVEGTQVKDSESTSESAPYTIKNENN